MKIDKSPIEGLVVMMPSVHQDSRGSFRRNFCRNELLKSGLTFNCAQGNVSINDKKFTMRGFHYQKEPSSESKILTVITGEIYNVVIDLRKHSKTYLQYFSMELRAKDFHSLLVPAGCANAFLTLQDNCIIQYYMGDYFNPERYTGFRYDDPYFDIKWPAKPIFISERDNTLPNFVESKL